jgi:hypothetical protein
MIANVAHIKDLQKPSPAYQPIQNMTRVINMQRSIEKKNNTTENVIEERLRKDDSSSKSAERDTVYVHEKFRPRTKIFAGTT